MKQGEVYTPINPQLKYHSQLQALSSSFLPIKSHFPPADELLGELCASRRGTDRDEWGEINWKLRKRRIPKIASSSSAGQTGKRNCVQKADLENWVANVYSHRGLGLQTDFLMKEARRLSFFTCTGLASGEISSLPLEPLASTTLKTRIFSGLHFIPIKRR